MSRIQYHVSYRWYYAVILVLINNLSDNVHNTVLLTISFFFCGFVGGGGGEGIYDFHQSPQSPGSLVIPSQWTSKTPQALPRASSFLEKIGVIKCQLSHSPLQVKFGNHKLISIFICVSPILIFVTLSDATLPTDPLFPLLSPSGLAVQIPPLLCLSAVFPSPLTLLILQNASRLR